MGLQWSMSDKFKTYISNGSVKIKKEMLNTSKLDSIDLILSHEGCESNCLSKLT